MLWRNTARTFARHSYSAECLLIITLLWASIPGCSHEDSSITAADACTASVIKTSEFLFGLVDPLDDNAADSGSSVRLKWDPSSTALGYRLYIGTNSRNYRQVADVGLQTVARVSNLGGDMTYYFVVTAYNSAGESCPSNEVSVRIP